MNAELWEETMNLDGFGTLVEGMNGKDINKEKKTANVSLDNELTLIINEMETKKGGEVDGSSRPAEISFSTKCEREDEEERRIRGAI